MSFLIRAGLVIGILSWLALDRRSLPAAPDAAVAARAAWDALPDPVRAAALHAGAAEIARRAGEASAVTPSRDTLSDVDRKVPWRGAQTRADRARLTDGGERPDP